MIRIASSLNPEQLSYIGGDWFGLFLPLHFDLLHGHWLSLEQHSALCLTFQLTVFPVPRDCGLVKGPWWTVILWIMGFFHVAKLHSQCLCFWSEVCAAPCLSRLCFCRDGGHSGLHFSPFLLSCLLTVGLVLHDSLR